MDVKDVKCVLIGDKECGKSCMSISFSINSCPGDYIPTVLEYYSSVVNIDGMQVRLHLMDSSGMDCYGVVRHLTYQRAQVLLICFSIINSKSFRNVDFKWLPEAKQYCPKAKIILVGTKADMRFNEAATSKLKIINEKPVTYNEGLAMAKKIGALQYLECSAITQEGLIEVFEAVAKTGILPLETDNEFVEIDSDFEYESDD